jgi:hypothetical protein
LKSLPIQQAGSVLERSASPQRELIPSRVSPRTSATPRKVTETLITVAPSKALFPTGVIEKLPPVSAENSH